MFQVDKREFHIAWEWHLHRWVQWSDSSVCCLWVPSLSLSLWLALSHWDPYEVRRGGCLELYYCNMVEWFWCDSCLISTTRWFPSVLWHCWFGHLACKNCPRNDLLCVEWDVKSLHYCLDVLSGMLKPTHSFTHTLSLCCSLMPWLRVK